MAVSISSLVAIPSSNIRITLIQKGIPTRFTIKPGTSGAMTTVFPIDSPKRLPASTVSSLVAIVLTTSSSFISGTGLKKCSPKNLSALDANLAQTDAKNLNTLALHWTFDNITGSDSSGNFYYVTDLSSGSAEIRNNFGWIGGISGYQYTGYGFGYAASSTNVVKKGKHNVLKFVDPESAVSSNMINVLSDSDKMFNLSQDKPEYYHVLEKSMYGAISEDMMDFFAGIVDFNNIIGEPVHRYRQEYKTLSKLREIYFRKVTEVSSVNKFISPDPVKAPASYPVYIPVMYVLSDSPSIYKSLV